MFHTGNFTAAQMAMNQNTPLKWAAEHSEVFVSCKIQSSPAPLTSKFEECDEVEMEEEPCDPCDPCDGSYQTYYEYV